MPLPPEPQDARNFGMRSQARTHRREEQHLTQKALTPPSATVGVALILMQSLVWQHLPQISPPSFFC